MKIFFEILVILALSLFLLSMNGLNISALFIISCILIIYSLVILKRVITSINKKWLKKLYNIYKFVVIIFISSFLIVEGMIILSICNHKDMDDINDINDIIVLGAGLNDNKVGKLLKNRLDKAIEYYKLNNDVNIILSVGLKPNNTISEADAMYNYLISMGISKNKIIKEDKALNTFENIKYTKEILKSRNDLDKHVLIITSEFHIFRSLMISNLLGLKSEGLACYTPIKMRVNYMISEYISITRDFIKGNIYKLDN
ncbi:DUF218 domain [uncultured Clostridium sp.]|nr:DUF218 domain [uncultured Clostridium sp.]